MSRRICVELYDEIIKLRPTWYQKDDDKGFAKVVMTGSAGDPVEWQEHIRNKIRRDEIANQFKDPESEFKLVLVRDMWLTGFDAPSLHTMYIDKPAHSHGLMQTIARVNRVFKDKPGGLIVDYLGIADDLKKALSEYTISGGRGKPAFDQEEAVAVMLEKFEIVSAMFHKFDYKRCFTAKSNEKLYILKEAIEHILKRKDGKERFINSAGELLKAFALSVPHPEALNIRDDVAFFQAVRAQLLKTRQTDGQRLDKLETALKQIISKAIVSDKVIDIFGEIGLNKPDISILSDEFLADVRTMPQKNLALEMLKKLLNEKIKALSRKNLVTARSFAEMLEKAIKQYQNRAIDTVQVIEELIELAKRFREEQKRGEKLNLTEDELAFYDALGVNDSAVKVLGDETLRTIARELVDTVRKNVTIDWTLRESVQAKLRVMVKRILRKYGLSARQTEKGNGDGVGAGNRDL